jgi:hypothetical protein
LTNRLFVGALETLVTFASFEACSAVGVPADSAFKLGTGLTVGLPVELSTAASLRSVLDEGVGIATTGVGAAAIPIEKELEENNC